MGECSASERSSVQCSQGIGRLVNAICGNICNRIEGLLTLTNLDLFAENSDFLAAAAASIDAIRGLEMEKTLV